MKLKISLIRILFLCLIAARCAIVPPPPPPSELGPEVRIGIAENLDMVTFETNQELDAWDQDGRALVQLL